MRFSFGEGDFRIHLEGIPGPTNSGKWRFIYEGSLHRNEQIISSLLVGRGYPPRFTFIPHMRALVSGQKPWCHSRFKRWVILKKGRSLKTKKSLDRMSSFLTPFCDYIVCTFHTYIYIYIYTPKPGRSPTRQYSVLSCFFPSSAASDFFGFQEAFSSCGSSQSSASGWKAFEGLTFAYPAEQATRYSFSAVSTSKSPGQRCSLAAASTWTRFFREEATKRPTLFIRLRLPLMAPKRLSALLSPPATKKQRLVSFTRPCRRFACFSRVLAWELGKDPFQSFTVGVKIVVKCDTPFKWIFSIFEAALLKAGDPSAATIVSFCRDRRRAGRTSDVLSAPPAPRLPCVFLSLRATTDQPLFNRLSMTCILPANVRFFPSFLAPNCAVSVSTMSLSKVICCAWTYSWRSKSSNQSRIGESFESGIRNVEQKRKYVWKLDF